MLKKLYLRTKGFRKARATKKLALVVFVLIFISFLITPISAYADVGTAMTNVFAWILDLLMGMIMALVTLMLNVLINIAQFNEFTSATAVETGWVLVRDICNMFFIVILLVISVGTVLGVESYSYRNFLKKVIIMAILINFSKTIAGFLIDVSQIIMLTFVAAFKDSIVVGFSEAFGLNKLKSLSNSMNAGGEIEQDNYALLLGMIFGLAISIILLLAIIAVIAMLAVRIVTLWILVVLSPFAYLASALPGSLGGQAKQWWSQFSEQLIVGPAIAFFLWLTLSVVSSTGGKFTQEESAIDSPSIIGGALASAPFLLNYILGIAILIIGMKMAQQMGGSTGAFMGKAYSKAKSYGGKALKGTYKGLKTGVSYAKDATLDALDPGGKEARLDKLKAKADAGGISGLLAARSLDKRKVRDDKIQEFAGKYLKKFGFGGEESINVIDEMRRKKAENAASQAKKNAAKVAANEFDEPTKQNELINQERKERKYEAMNKAKAKAGNDWNNLSETEKNKYKDKEGKKADKDVYIEQMEESAGKEVDKMKNSEFKDTARSKYISQQQNKAAEEARAEAGPGRFSSFNPLRAVYDYAAKQEEGKNRALNLGQVLAINPGALETNDLVDKKGLAMHGTIKKAFGEMSSEQLQGLVDHWKGEKDAGTEGADKVYDNLAIAVQYANKNNIAFKKVDSVYGKIKDEKVQASGKSTKVSDLDTKKSKSFMEDIDDKQVLNTAVEIENEIDYMGETEVRAGKDDDGWQVDEGNNREAMARNKVALMRDGETKEVDKDAFMQQNSSVLVDHFYNSDRFARLKADQGEDAFVSREKYDDFERIGKSSREGITLGSLTRGGNMSAMDFSALADKTGELKGTQRKAGMFVEGDEAIKAATAMQEMLTEQTNTLAEAETDEEITEALDSFGVKPSEGADLQEMKASTLASAAEAQHNLQDEDKIKSEGLILINKKRTGREARGLIRHERAHDIIEKSDEDDEIQTEVWDAMLPEEQEQAREYIRKDRNDPDMDEEEIRKEYIADAFANTYKPGGAKEGEPVLPLVLAERLKQAKEMKLDTADVEESQTKQNFLSTRIIAYRAKKQRLNEAKLTAAKQAAEQDWDADKEQNMEAMKEQSGNQDLTEEQAKEMFVNEKTTKLEQTAKLSMQKKAEKYQAKKAKKDEKLKTKKKKKEQKYNTAEQKISDLKQSFAKRYNTRQESQRKLNTQALQLEQEAEQALNKGNEKEYVTKMDEARGKRKQAQTLARENKDEKLDYGKKKSSLMNQARKAKKKTVVSTPEYDPNVWNDAMSGKGKLGKIVYSAAGRQLGVKSIADLTLHGLAKIGIAKNLAASTSDTYKYEMQKKQVNMERGQFSELFVGIDGLVTESLKNNNSTKDSQKIIDKKAELMQKIDNSKSMSTEDKSKFKEKIGAVVDNMMEAKGGVDAQRFTKANELMNAYMKTKVSGASIAKDALNSALVLSTGGLGTGVASARMALFAGTNLANRIGKSKANYIKEGKSGSKIGNTLKDVTVGSLQESYRSIAEGKGFKGKALGVAGAVGKLSTAYAISAGITDSDEFITAFTQTDDESVGNVFEQAGKNLVTNAKAVGARYASIPSRLKSMISEEQTPVIRATTQAIEPLGPSTEPPVSSALGEELSNSQGKIDNDVQVDQETVFAAESIRQTEPSLRISEKAAPIEYIPYQRSDSLINPTADELIDRGLPQTLAHRIDGEIGATGANSVQFMEKMNKDGSAYKQVAWIDKSGQTQTETFDRVGPKINTDYGDPPPPPENNYTRFANTPEQVKAATLTEVYADQGIRGDVAKVVANDGWHVGNGKLEFSETPNSASRQELIWTDNNGTAHKYEYDVTGDVFINEQPVDIISRAVPASDTQQDKAYAELVNMVINKKSINQDEFIKELNSKIQDNTLKGLPEQEQRSINNFVESYKLSEENIRSTEQEMNINRRDIIQAQEKLKINQDRLFMAKDDVDSRLDSADLNQLQKSTEELSKKIEGLKLKNNELNAFVDKEREDNGQTVLDMLNKFLDHKENVDMDYQVVETPSEPTATTTQSKEPVEPPSEPTVASKTPPESQVASKSQPKTIPAEQVATISHDSPAVVEKLVSNDEASVEKFVGNANMRGATELGANLQVVAESDDISTEDKIEILKNIKNELVDRMKNDEGSNITHGRYGDLIQKINSQVRNFENAIQKEGSAPDQVT